MALVDYTSESSASENGTNVGQHPPAKKAELDNFKALPPLPSTPFGDQSKAPAPSPTPPKPDTHPSFPKSPRANLSPGIDQNPPQGDHQSLRNANASDCTVLGDFGESQSPLGDIAASPTESEQDLELVQFCGIQDSDIAPYTDTSNVRDGFSRDEEEEVLKFLATGDDLSLPPGGVDHDGDVLMADLVHPPSGGADHDGDFLASWTNGFGELSPGFWGGSLYDLTTGPQDISHGNRMEWPNKPKWQDVKRSYVKEEPIMPVTNNITEDAEFKASSKKVAEKKDEEEVYRAYAHCLQLEHENNQAYRHLIRLESNIAALQNRDQPLPRNDNQTSSRSHDQSPNWNDERIHDQNVDWTPELGGIQNLGANLDQNPFQAYDGVASQNHSLAHDQEPLRHTPQQHHEHGHDNDQNLHQGQNQGHYQPQSAIWAYYQKLYRGYVPLGHLTLDQYCGLIDHQGVGGNFDYNHYQNPHQVQNQYQDQYHPQNTAPGPGQNPRRDHDQNPRQAQHQEQDQYHPRNIALSPGQNLDRDHPRQVQNQYHDQYQTQNVATGSGQNSQRGLNQSRYQNHGRAPGRNAHRTSDQPRDRKHNSGQHRSQNLNQGPRQHRTSSQSPNRGPDQNPGQSRGGGNRGVGEYLNYVPNMNIGLDVYEDRYPNIFVPNKKKDKHITRDDDVEDEDNDEEDYDDQDYNDDYEDHGHGQEVSLRAEREGRHGDSQQRKRIKREQDD